MTAGALAFWCTPAAGVSAVTRFAATRSAAPAVLCSHAVTATPAPAVLAGVAAVSPGDAWAVGWTSGGAPRPVLAHWNGSAWSTVSSPALLAPAVLTAVAKFPGGV